MFEEIKTLLQIRGFQRNLSNETLGSKNLEPNAPIILSKSYLKDHHLIKSGTAILI